MDRQCHQWRDLEPSAHLSVSGVGLYFSLRSRFLQLRHMKEMVRLMFDGKSTDAGVSSFQALAMTLAGRVGTGNIAGVATAITFGGPGALFWMWMVAFLGASSAFVESTLGQVYKEKINGEYRGGPALPSRRARHEVVRLDLRHRHHLRLRRAAAGRTGELHRLQPADRLCHRST